jgi:hypothetical protein
MRGEEVITVLKTLCNVVWEVKFTGVSLRLEEVNFFFSLLLSSSYRKPKNDST